MARIAAVVTWVQALAFGLPAIPVSVFLLREDRLPWLWGLFPMYGGPWEEKLSSEMLVVLLGLFLGLSLISSAGAWLLWRGRRAGGLLAAVTLPLEAVFWWGFALPLPVVGGLVRLALIVTAWPGLEPPARTPTGQAP